MFDLNVSRRLSTANKVSMQDIAAISVIGQQRAQAIDVALRRFCIDARIACQLGHIEQVALLVSQHGPEAAQRLDCEARPALGMSRSR